MYVFPDTVKEAVIRSVKLCVFSVVPSLFPFVTATRLIINFVSFDSNNSFEKFRSPFFSKAGITVFILGLVSGFPAGALLAGQGYKNGILTKNEAERISVYSSVASPSFCIIFFGGNILNNRLYGLIVYLAIVTSSLVLLSMSSFFKKEKQTAYAETSACIPKKASASDVIASSCITMINVCAFITFFSCIGAVLSRIFIFSGTESPFLLTLIQGIPEFTSGISAAYDLRFGQRVLTGTLLLGFGGISAIMQIYSVCESFGISCRTLLPVRIASAPLSVFVAICYFYVYGTVKKHSVTVVVYMTFLFAIAVLFCILSKIIKICRKKYKKSKVNF